MLDQLALRYVGRRLGHVTPRYLFDLARVRAFELRDPAAPWLTRDAVKLLDTMLRLTDRGVEYGSGRSTAWLARRTASLVSVEADGHWHSVVSAQLRAAGLTDKVELRLIPADAGRAEDPYRSEYLAVLDRASPASLDFVLVDAQYRGECAIRAIDVLKVGGLLIVDNIHLYLPNRSRSPLSTRRMASPTWQAFADRVANSRLIWTSSGVTDTAIWIKAD